MLLLCFGTGEWVGQERRGGGGGGGASRLYDAMQPCKQAGTACCVTVSACSITLPGCPASSKDNIDTCAPLGCMSSSILLVQGIMLASIWFTAVVQVQMSACTPERFCLLAPGLVCTCSLTCLHDPVT